MVISFFLKDEVIHLHFITTVGFCSVLHQCFWKDWNVFKGVNRRGSLPETAAQTCIFLIEWKQSLCMTFIEGESCL